MVGLIDKLKSSKTIVKLDEVETDYGPGYQAQVKVGNTTKTCTLIQDKVTGQWQPQMGDPGACRILKRTIADLGSPLNSGPLEGASENEMVREQPI